MKHRAAVCGRHQDALQRNEYSGYNDHDDYDDGSAYDDVKPKRKKAASSGRQKASAVSAADRKKHKRSQILV